MRLLMATPANFSPLPRMSSYERAKLIRFTHHIDFNGDLRKAAAKARISKTLLEKWMSSPEISARITHWIKRRRRTEAFLLVNRVKCASKIGPFSLKPGVKGSPKLCDIDWGNWLPVAKSAARSFKTCKRLEVFRVDLDFVMSTQDKRLIKQFFIDLGKCLSGEIDCEQWDNLDIEVTDIVLENPSISSQDAARELEHRGFGDVTADLFRMRKKRLGLSKPNPRRAAQPLKA
jgi:hypothetical protein